MTLSQKIKIGTCGIVFGVLVLALKDVVINATLTLAGM